MLERIYRDLINYNKMSKMLIVANYNKNQKHLF